MKIDILFNIVRRMSYLDNIKRVDEPFSYKINHKIMNLKTIFCVNDYEAKLS